MAYDDNQIDKNKRRILYIRDFLEENTDENFSVTMHDIIEYLKKRYDIEVDRKTIVRDLHALEDYLHLFIDLENGKHWKLVERTFDLDEVRMLVDCVVSSRFISEKTTKTVLEKLYKLVSKHQRRILDCAFDMSDYNKSQNNSVHRIIDSIHTAIANGLCVEFQYYQYNMHKEQELTEDGKIYQVQPIRLYYDNNFCFFHAKEGAQYRVFRIDKMTNVHVSDHTFRFSRRYALQKSFLESDRKREEEAVKKREVQIIFEQDMMDAVIDRFGQNVYTEIVDSNHFRIKAVVNPNLQFFSWIFGLGDKAMIEYPLEVAAQMMDLLKERYKAYREDHSRNIYYYRRKTKKAESSDSSN